VLRTLEAVSIDISPKARNSFLIGKFIVNNLNRNQLKSCVIYLHKRLNLLPQFGLKP
jgi:hypothetical protein